MRRLTMNIVDSIKASHECDASRLEVRLRQSELQRKPPYRAAHDRARSERAVREKPPLGPGPTFLGSALGGSRGGPRLCSRGAAHAVVK